MKEKVFIKTFGCRTNAFDSQVMIEHLKDFELTQDEASAHIIIINSCTVTNGADAGVRNYLSRVQKLDKKIYFTGCGVSTQGAKLAPQIQGVFSHQHKENINELLKKKQSFFLPPTDTLHIDRTIVSEFVGKSRAFIKIQEGCDFACSYCIIPFTRGRARSLPEDSILTQVRLLAQKGVQEVVLTGTNMGSYGKDSNSSIAKLIKALAQIQGIKRIRLGSLEPSQIDAEFLELLDEGFMARHLHIALQHSHDAMLTLMNRQNRFKSDLALLEKIAERGFALGSDYIVGHPGESEEIWAQAFANLQLLPLTHIHPFIYSPRDGTPSASLKPRIRGDIAKSRLHQVNALIAKKNLAFRQKNATLPLQVLIESHQEGRATGLDQFFNKMQIHTHSLLDTWISISNYEVQSHCNSISLEAL